MKVFSKRRHFGTGSATKPAWMEQGRGLLAGLAIACIAASAAAPQVAAGDTSSTAVGLYGDFRNPLVLPPGSNPPADQATSATFFGGHIQFLPDTDGTPVVPTDGTVRLVASSFGQMVARTIPFPGFEDAALENARKRLYWDQADDSPEHPKNAAALRYKHLLYGVAQRDDGQGGTEPVVVPRFEAMATLWRSADRQRALEAAAEIVAALRYAPFDASLRHALLDVLYEVALADLMVAKEHEVDAVRAAMGFPGYQPVFGDFAISEEIAYLELAMEAYLSAAQPYFDLFSDPMGIGTGAAGDAARDQPFGYYLFQREVPSRSLDAPTFADQDGEPQPVLDEDGDGVPDEIVSGFKDLILLFQIERDVARTGARLARLYGLRAYQDDRQRAYELIGQLQQRSYTDGQILNGIFTEAELSMLPETAGLDEARSGWAQALTTLSMVKGFLDGDANPLGLAPDFLALVQNDSGDSYGYFKNLLIPGGDANGLGGALGDAMIKYNAALASYDTFRHYQDRLADELIGQRRQHADRLRAIVGCEYPEAPDPLSCYYTPEDNEGGEIYQQLQNIELARLRIERNQQEIENLQQQIEIEIDRRGKEAGVNDLIAKTYIRYGNKQARITEEIGRINADQAYANGMAQAAASLGSLNFTLGGAGFAAYGINANIQAALERKKGKLNAQKERLSAQQSADITYLSDQISAFHSEAVVKNLLLGMSTLAIESSEAAVVLAQEMGRLTALLDEKDYLETQWAEANAQTASRYFADPSHRIIHNNEVLAAGRAFEKAQLWVFILARALDYRLNEEIETPDLYKSSTVFKLRNAKELVDMAVSVADWAELRELGERGGSNFEKFSVREDFLGYRRTSYLDTLIYQDPITGDPVDGLTAFRSYLKKLPRFRPTWAGFREVIRIEFSTVKTNTTETFFAQARWNEKINFVAVKINAESLEPHVQVLLKASGTGFVRNKSRGYIEEPEDPEDRRPDRLVGEMTGYPMKRWYLSFNPVQGGYSWASTDWAFAFPAMVSRDPDASPKVYERREFHELSPAVTHWTLEVPVLASSGEPIFDLDRISDIEIWFENYSLGRDLSKLE